MLKLQNIEKNFGKESVLKDVSFKAEKGEIISILGISGSGKSTLLNIILGLETPNGGEIYFNDENITKTSLEQRQFNIVFQDYTLFPNLNVYENIVYGLKNNKNLTSQKEVDDLINLLDLSNHVNKSIHKLSGGQKQRVALARTLVMKPRILLLDEPLSALDGVIKESIKARIKEIAKTMKLTTIIVTHDPEEAMSLSDKVLILDKGKVAQFGTPMEIIKETKSDFVQRFIVQQLQIKQANIQNIFVQEGSI